MSDPFGHRKYHSLYFILGFLIAVVVVMLMGCERGTDSHGRACTAVLGIGVTGDACEPEQIIIEPVNCCMALIPSCMACQEGISTTEWLEQTCGVDAISAEYYGWNSELNEPIWLCQAQGVPQWLD